VGATAVGAVAACLDTSLTWLAALLGIRSRRVAQNELAASTTAALINA